MGRRRHTPEQIITALREAEVGLASGKTAAMVSRELGISEQPYYRWWKEFGGLRVDQGLDRVATVEGCGHCVWHLPVLQSDLLRMSQSQS